MSVPVIKSLKQQHISTNQSWLDSDQLIPVNYPINKKPCKIYFTRFFIDGKYLMSIQFDNSYFEMWLLNYGDHFYNVPIIHRHQNHVLNHEVQSGYDWHCFVYCRIQLK